MRDAAIFPPSRPDSTKSLRFIVCLPPKQTISKALSRVKGQVGLIFGIVVPATRTDQANPRENARSGLASNEAGSFRTRRIACGPMMRLPSTVRPVLARLLARIE
jgi:hypothetical protein